MKKIMIIIICCLNCVLLFGCGEKEQTDMTESSRGSKSGITVSFVNEVYDADIWILPDTQENRKTTVWGTATISKLEKDGEKQIEISSSEQSEAYLVRIIDMDGMYYSANEISLSDGCRVRFKKSDDGLSEIIEVSDSNGEIQKTYPVFSAKL